MTDGPDTVTPRLVVAIVVVVGSLGVGAWVTLVDEPSLPSPEAAVDRFDTTDAYALTYEVTVETEEETSRQVVRVVASPDSGALRSTVRAPPPEAGNQFVSNGSVAWTYNASENRVSRIRLSERRLFDDRRRRVRRLVAAARGDRATVDLSPLPTVPGAASGSAERSGNRTAPLTVSYAGTERVAGRSAFVFELRPSAEGATRSRRTVWYDAEHFVLLRARIVTESDGGRTVVTQRARNVSFDVPTDPGRFQFTPPADAELDRGRTRAFDSRTALAAATALPVPDPEVPDRFALRQAVLVERQNRTGVTLRYGSGLDSVTVIVGTGSQFRDVTGEAVSLGNRTGTYTEQSRAATVVWTCGDLEYGVITTLPREPTLSVARSVACRADPTEG